MTEAWLEANQASGHSEMHVKTRLRILLAVAGVITAGCVGWYFAWFRGDRDGVRQIAFDSDTWQRAEPIEGHRTVRSQMIQDLIRRHKFAGWTRSQVIALLGEPTHGEPAKMGFSQWDAVYVLGLERAGDWSLDDEALGFKFDSTNRVTKYGLSVN